MFTNSTRNPDLSQINPVHFPGSYFFGTNLKVLPSSTTGFSDGALVQIIRIKFWYKFINSHHMSQCSLSFHLPRPDNENCGRHSSFFYIASFSSSCIQVQQIFPVKFGIFAAMEIHVVIL
jgi:hypothetical protein